MTRPKDGDLRVVEGEPGTFIIEEFNINKYSLIDRLFKFGRWSRCYYQVYWVKEFAINKAKEMAAKREKAIKEKEESIKFAKRKKNVIWKEK